MATKCCFSRVPQINARRRRFPENKLHTDTAPTILCVARLYKKIQIVPITNVYARGHYLGRAADFLQGRGGASAGHVGKQCDKMYVQINKNKYNQRSHIHVCVCVCAR
jgi:hypothetical protein